MLTLRQSSIGAYEKCHRIALLDFGAIGTGEPEKDDSQNNGYAQFGILLHEIWDRMCKESITDLSKLYDMYEEKIDTITLPEGKESDFRAKGYEQIEWVFENYNYKPLETEYNFEGVYIPSIGMEFTGTIDRIDGTPKDYILQDYKTGNHAKFTKKELTNNVQATIYSYAAKEKYGVFPKEFSFIFTDSKRVKTIQITPEFLDAGIRRAKASYIGMMKGDWSTLGTKTDHFCKNFCEHYVSCPKFNTKNTGWAVFSA